MSASLMKNLGQYVGDGTWRDDAGETKRYRVEMTIEPAEGGARLAFRHIFGEEPDQPDILQSFEFTIVAPSILRFELGDMVGRGYFADDLLHYTIPIPGNAVEVTYFFADGGIRVAGSAEKNAAGRYIMWDEVLERA